MEGRDWLKAFYDVIPKRKGVTVLSQEGNDDSTDENETMETKQLKAEQCDDEVGESSRSCNSNNSESKQPTEANSDDNTLAPSCESMQLPPEACIGLNLLTGRSIDLEINCNRHEVESLEPFCIIKFSQEKNRTEKET